MKMRPAFEDAGRQRIPSWKPGQDPVQGDGTRE
jgi:hypothetical protein